MHFNERRGAFIELSGSGRSCESMPLVDQFMLVERVNKRIRETRRAELVARSGRQEVLLQELKCNHEASNLYAIPALSFDLSKRHNCIAMHINDLLKSKRDEILAIAAKHGAHNVRVFGSVARGEADSQSDIDLLVEFQRGMTLLGHAALIQELEDLLGVKVDLVSDRGLRERIQERVLSEAVAL
jgi:uncharacterized protein